MSWPNANQQPSGYPQPYGHQQPRPYPPAAGPYPPGAQPYPPAAHPYFPSQVYPPAAHPYFPSQVYPPPPQPPAAAAPWPVPPSSQASHPMHPAAGDQRLFQVRIRKHTGAIILMFNQTYTVTGTLAQCEAALRNALLHNLLAGWWSVGSALIWNWVALVENHSARKHLHRQATQAYTAQRAP